MRRLGIEEWLVLAVMSMYTGVKTVVRTVYGNSNGRPLQLVDLTIRPGWLSSSQQPHDTLAKTTELFTQFQHTPHTHWWRHLLVAVCVYRPPGVVTWPSSTAGTAVKSSVVSANLERDCAKRLSARKLYREDAMEMEEADKGWLMTMIGVGEWMFLLGPAHPGCPRQNPDSRKTVVCFCVCVMLAGSITRTLQDVQNEKSEHQLEVYVSAALMICLRTVVLVHTLWSTSLSF